MTETKSIQQRIMEERSKNGLKTVLNTGFVHYAKDERSKKDFERRAVKKGYKIC